MSFFALRQGIGAGDISDWRDQYKLQKLRANLALRVIWFLPQQFFKYVLVERHWQYEFLNYQKTKGCSQSRELSHQQRVETLHKT